MAITNLGELKTAVSTWLYGAGFVSAQADDIVLLAHEYLMLKVRYRDMVTKTDLTIASNEFTLPDDFIEALHVAELASERRPLAKISWANADVLYPERPSGLADHYALRGTKLIAFPYPSNSVELTYIAKTAYFANDAATNWLLDKCPNLYLAAALMYAAEFAKEDGEVQKQATICDTFIGLINAEFDVAEFSQMEYQAEGPTP